MFVVKPTQTSLLDLSITTSGLTVYLDNFAIKELAKDNPSRRKRFIDAVNSGVDVLFSPANAAELTGPQDGSFAIIRDFLDEIGPHWYPVEFNANEIIDRELKGDPPDKSCFSDRFLRDYVVVLLKDRQNEIVDISGHFFRLGPMMDWVGRQRESIRGGLADCDEMLLKRIEAHRAKHDADPQWLDTTFPAVPYSASHRATFTYLNLVRNLILEFKGYRLKPGDGIDFCQAVIASSFSCVATLDKHWKRRVESLPKPNGLARIYYSLELDQMVDDIEKTVAQIRTP